MQTAVPVGSAAGGFESCSAEQLRGPRMARGPGGAATAGSRRVSSSPRLGHQLIRAVSHPPAASRARGPAPARSLAQPARKAAPARCDAGTAPPARQHEARRRGSPTSPTGRASGPNCRGDMKCKRPAWVAPISQSLTRGDCAALAALPELQVRRRDRRTRTAPGATPPGDRDSAAQPGPVGSTDSDRAAVTRPGSHRRRLP